MLKSRNYFTAAFAGGVWVGRKFGLACCICRSSISWEWSQMLLPYLPFLWSVKTQAFPAAPWSLLEHRQILSELEPTQAQVHFFLLGWLTDLWLLKLQPFTRIQMVSSLAKYGPSLHLGTDHWQQIWMNFNWKSWKMLSVERGVIYDMISLWFRGRQSSSPCLQSRAGREKCKQWIKDQVW